MLLAEALQARGASAHVHLIDISPQAIEHTEQRLTRLHLSVVGHQSTYEDGLRAGGRRASRRRAHAGAAARVQHRQLRYAGGGTRSSPGSARTVAPGDFLLLGADLAKPERDLLLAYDDPLGVTAAFNKNLLVRINNELGGDFDLDAFDHRRGLERGGPADRDAPGEPCRAARARPGRGDDRDVRGGGADLDGELLQVRAGADRRQGADAGFACRAISGSTAIAGFALTLFAAV